MLTYETNILDLIWYMSERQCRTRPHHRALYKHRWSTCLFLSRLSRRSGAHHHFILRRRGLFCSFPLELLFTMSFWRLYLWRLSYQWHCTGPCVFKYKLAFESWWKDQSGFVTNVPSADDAPHGGSLHATQPTCKMGNGLPSEVYSVHYFKKRQCSRVPATHLQLLGCCRWLWATFTTI